MNFVKQTKVLCINGKCKQMTTMNVSNPVPQKSHCNLVYSKFLDKLKFFFLIELKIICLSDKKTFLFPIC